MTDIGNVGGPRVLSSGDQAVAVEFGDRIDPAINDRVYAFGEQLSAAAPEWLVEAVPSYRSLLVQFDPFAIDTAGVTEYCQMLLGRDAATAGEQLQRRIVKFDLPVAYGGEHGPDLATVAEHAGLSEDEVVAIHSSTPYRVYMLGFSPGFPYLGGMDNRIACPRLQTPRVRVPAGSVGIAESQTGVYPSASPGGWQLIGRTPVRLFDVGHEPPALLEPGHFVQFAPVSMEEFEQIAREVETGKYVVQSVEMAR
jgi:inhibitor of KinA